MLVETAAASKGSFQIPADPYNLVIAGVGGQGNLLASQVLASAGLELGLYVTVGETYGASQRGGSVMSHIRFSCDFQYGPLVPRGRAHLIVAFEPLEGLRMARRFANPEAGVILNLRPSFPVGVISGKDSYPPVENLVERLKTVAARVYTLDATLLARQAGDPIAMNMVMVGAITRPEFLPIPLPAVESVLRKTFKGARLEVNRRALRLGLTAKLADG